MLQSKIFVGLTLLAALSGCSTTTDANREITVDDWFFEPKQATATAGDTFTFKSAGVNQHTVTVHRPPDAQGQFIKDTILNPGDTTTLTFDTTGVYHIFCKFHSRGQQGDYMGNMTMQVTVM